MGCPENFTHVSDKCMYVGHQTDWFTAVKSCHHAQANITLINISMDELRNITLILSQDISSLWIEAKRNGKFDPITYQLPSSSYYGKNLFQAENL
jgi:hypothetical protein